MLVGYNDNLVIHPKYSVLYTTPEFTSDTNYSGRRKNLPINHKPTRKELSYNAKKKLEKSINYLTYLANEKKVYNNKYKSTFKFKVSFLTLTLPASQIHSDSELNNKLLNQLLIELKQKWGIDHYVWKSEYQRNGNLHYHLLTNKFIPYNELRNSWNRILSKLGYIERFMKSNKGKSPNSTDIHSVRKVRDLSKYMCKYMLKGNGHQTLQVKRDISVHGTKKDIYYKYLSLNTKSYLRSQTNKARIWGCSQSLSNIKGAKTQDVAKYLHEFDKLEASQKAKKIIKDYCTIYAYNIDEINDSEYPLIKGLFNSYLIKQFNYTIQRKIFVT